MNLELRLCLYWSGDTVNGLSWNEVDLDTGLETEEFQETNDKAQREDIREKAKALGISITGDTPVVVFSDECIDCGKVSGYDGSGCSCREILLESLR